ncbi:MAG: hypothetical protein AMXMBFR84_25660 [Candidatus Hydrogenedentota bacterium]
MHKQSLRLWVSAGLGATLFFAGCAKDTAEHQFDPVPVARVGAQDLEPVSKPSTTELLAAADEAFRQANEAQEKGDNEGALRHYNRMLELLVEADLDPGVFYGLRDEFAHILSSTAETAELFNRDPSMPMPLNSLGIDTNGSTVPAQLPDRVVNEINEIQEAYRKNFQYGLDRSFKYRAHIETELAKAGLPKDLVWLAMVESQFHPNVVSHAGAAGMWQFMPATARRYGLRVDKYVDERRDWEKATAAAVRYLTDLGNMFQGEWPLAISAYNMGEYGLERAIAMNGGDRDLWRLLETPPAANHIQTETKKFFPKFLATVIVGKHFEKYGFEKRPQAPDDIERMTISGSYSLASLERSVGLPTGTLKRLNPELIQGATPREGEFAIAIPKGSQEVMLAALSKTKQDTGTMLASDTPSARRSGGGKVHVVRRGDTISGIAKKYRVDERELMASNNIKHANRLYTGKKLVIPGGSSEEPSPAVVAAVETDAAPKGGNSQQYKVKHGDTLGEIATKYGVSVADLRKWNNLQNRSHINVGETLVVGGSSSGDVKLAKIDDPVGDTVTHVVKSGEFPAAIAQKYGVKVNDLLAWNKLSKDTVIQVGDKLVLYNPTVTIDASVKPETEMVGTTAEIVPVVSNAESNAAKETKRTHRVAAGESPWIIANKYGVSLDQLLAWNSMTKKSTLSVGQEVIVDGGSGNDANTAPTAAVATHKVASGESASVIAQKYGMSLSAFLALNNMTPKSVLKVGEKVKVGGSGSAVAPTGQASDSQQGKKSTHTVRSGESPWTIAKKYNVSRDVLYKWNNWTSDPSLKIGEKITVYTK